MDGRLFSPLRRRPDPSKAARDIQEPERRHQEVPPFATKRAEWWTNGDRRTTTTLYAISIFVPFGDGLVILRHLGFAPPIYSHWGTTLRSCGSSSTEA